MLAVITVDSFLDNFDPGAPTTDGLITLREAILAANTDAVVGDAPAGSGADTIEFDNVLSGQTITLGGTDLALTDLADAFYNRANARSYTKAFDFAVADYGAAIVNKPKFPGAYYNRGFAFEASGRHTRAVADFMKARALGLQRLGTRFPDQPPPGR